MHSSARRPASTIAPSEPARTTLDLCVLNEVEQKVLWLSTAIIDAANAPARKDPDGLTIGVHQASCASAVTLMTALWFTQLTADDRVSVKPHASPVLHAINYLLGELRPDQLGTLRALKGLQSYPSRSKDPDTVDYSTGSVGIGATAPLWGAIARRTEFGQTGTLHELYQLHGIGPDAIVAAALDLLDPSPHPTTPAPPRPDHHLNPQRREQMPENKAKNWPVNPPKLHHTTFTTLRMEKMVEWYGLVCGLRPVFQSDEASWLTNDDANHRIALLSPPGLKHPTDKGHETGIHHTAFEFSTFDMWLNNYLRLRDHGLIPFLTLDHGITMSVYYQDPDGNGVEIQVDGFGDWADSTEWISSAKEFAANPIGVFFDPEKLVAARDQGLKFQEIHERTRAGEYLPAVIPEDIFLPEVW